MRFSIITPNYNGAAFLEETIRSVLAQRQEGIDLEYIIVDGGSTDGSQMIIERYRDAIAHVIVEKDNGPASAINKGFSLATGDVIAWLNADDIYFENTLPRLHDFFLHQPIYSFCFGKCLIVDTSGCEIRKSITRFKELFFPLSSQFTLQCINYISQPAMFFRRTALQQVGLLREDMVAAWDYEFLLRLWRYGDCGIVSGGPLSAFRWHESSISGKQFYIQFKEEIEAAIADAGRYSPQRIIHSGVRWGITGVYSFMAKMKLG